MVRVKWNRVLTIYSAVAIASLVLGLCLGNAGAALRVIGVLLIGGFIPMIMLVYFMRGFRGMQ